MQLPFTIAQFYGVLREYKTTVWPAQFFLLVLAVTAIGLVAYPRAWSGAGVSANLAFFWAWIGVVYHLAFVTTINPVAYVFAALSVSGALVVLWQGVVHRRLEFRFSSNTRTGVGRSLVVVALVTCPAWSLFALHHYPNLPTFGLFVAAVVGIALVVWSKAGHARKVVSP